MGSDDAASPEDMPSLVHAYCEATIVRIPSGVCGSVVAVSWVRAFSQACRLGWGDITDSAPGHFRRLVGERLVDGCPSDRAMVAATRLVASVSGLVTARSARRWTAWYASACDPDSALGQEVRRAVTPAMRERARSRTQALEEPRAPELPESGTLRAERDELAKALRMTQFELEHVRAAELATGARCKIAEAAHVSELRKNVDLLDQLRHAQDRAERALRPTREPVCSNRCQELEEQLRDLETLHTFVLQKFAEMTDSFVEVLCKSQTEVALWRLQSPGVSMEQELNELAETQAENVRIGKDRVREELARGGINLPSSD